MLPTVQTNTFFPSFSSVCIVYSDDPGGVFSIHGLSFVRFNWVATNSLLK